MTLRELSALILLGAIWGSSYIFINVAVQSIAPFFLMDARVLIAGVVLFIYAVMIQKVPQLRAQWKQFLILGTLNSAIPFVLIGLAQANPDFTASLGAILNSTTPLFAAIVATIWLGTKLTIPKVTGLFLGILGVAVLMGWSPMAIDSGIVISSAESLLAALCYGIGGVYAKKTFTGVSSLTLAIGQLIGASIFLFVPASLNIPTIPPSFEAIFSLITLAILCTAFAYILYFYLLERTGPTKTLSVTFLVPVFAIIWGILFLGEPISVGMIVGLGIIFTSVSLVTEINLRLFFRQVAYRVAQLL